MADGRMRKTQSTAARVAGWTLLLLMVSGFVGMFAFGKNPVVDGNTVLTAQNILARETAFRGSLGCVLIMLNCDIVLALALYALLKLVNAPLALLGAFWRFANAVVLGVAVAASLVALDLIGNPHIASNQNADQLHAIALIFFVLHNRLSFVGLTFFCLGAGVHSWLLYKSRYIPRIISGLYMFACLEMLLCCFCLLVFPKLKSMLDPAFVVPDVLAELSAALWLAFKGAKLPSAQDD